MYQSILTEVDSGVGIITLNRPEQRNALNGELIRELIDAIVAMETDPAVKVLVISSAGRSFCGGIDLEGREPAADMANEERQNLALHTQMLEEMQNLLKQMNKPTLARVQGSAYGAGAALVAICDIAIATFDAQFSLNEIKRGLFSGLISPHVIAAIGERYARRYLLTGETFAAAEAYRIGLVHEIVADEAALDDAVGEIVDSLLKQNALGNASE